ncbi:unnamed protein product [Zymoseptoria tritici ST99CH_3D1]|nr:unnamed protein product [Zymoseptoria tritici ST99CH_3D1]
MDLQESTVGIIHLEDDHPTAIEAMVNFVCTEGTNYPVVSSDASYLSLEVHVRIYNLADKYNIVLLAQLAAEAFLTFEARDAPPSDLHFVIRELYDNSPDNPTTLKMKTRLVAACVEHEKALTNDPKHVQFREVFAEIIPFALAFQQAVIAMDTLKELEILDAHPKSTRDPEVRIDCQNPRCAEDFVMRWSKGWSGDRYWCPFCGVQFTRTSYQERITD